MATLKELREKHYLSQEDLAGKSGMTASTINRLENGKQKAQFGTIRKLAKALGVEPVDINFNTKA
ncbi:helix-turn-helix transcriptional regulator [Patescibacteria group bacterium]|nr:helix-turn-helix transcriptional regulator [Patescibacteria group bacterium]